MTFANNLKKAKMSKGLLVTPKVHKFLLDNPEGIIWDEDAIDFFTELVVAAQMNGNERAGRFGTSARGKCERAQVFGYLGMPSVRVMDSTTINLFLDGKFRHIKWQVVAYQAGAIEEAEVAFSDPNWMLATRIDGLHRSDDYFVEFKGDRQNVRTINGVPDEHMLQIHTQFLVTGMDTCAYVNEDKTNQDWKEIIVHPQRVWEMAVKSELERLIDAVETETLPDVLTPCQAKEGPYRGCGYGPACLALSARGDGWPDAADPDWPALT